MLSDDCTQHRRGADFIARRVSPSRPPVRCIHAHARKHKSFASIWIIPAYVFWNHSSGFFDFISLEKSAFCVLSDSGTVQGGNLHYGRFPNVVIRDVTERPETVECGSAVLAGSDTQTILRMVDAVTSEKRSWNPPAEYLALHVAATGRREL